MNNSDYLWLAILAQIALVLVYILLWKQPWLGEIDDAPHVRHWDEKPDDDHTLYCVPLTTAELREIAAAAKFFDQQMGQYMHDEIMRVTTIYTRKMGRETYAKRED